MANKASTHLKSIAKGITVKRVKRANMWVVTFPKDNKTVQEWFEDKPTEDQLLSIKEQATIKE